MYAQNYDVTFLTIPGGWFLNVQPNFFSLPYFILFKSQVQSNNNKLVCFVRSSLAVFLCDMHCCSFSTKMLAHTPENFTPSLAGSASLTHQNLVLCNGFWLIINLYATRQLLLGHGAEQVADVSCLLREEIVGELGHRLAHHMSVKKM